MRDVSDKSGSFKRIVLSVMKIKIVSESIGEVIAELTGENPNTAKNFYDALPIEGNAQLWGDEIYFSIPLKIEKENSRVVVKQGEIAIWVENPSLCIFFGKTPVSTDAEIRAYSDVNVIGNVQGDPTIFKKVKNSELITINKS